MTLASPKELKNSFPLSQSARSSIENQRQEIIACLDGKDPRIVLIAGPCSLHNQESALNYACRLKELQQEVADTFLLVMRAYVEKPRTCLGWKGPLYNPYIDSQDDLTKGVMWTRETLLKLTACGIPLATEFLEPLAAPYFEDLIAIGFIGSRTTSSQIHRQLASSLPLPIGFKNTPDGSTLSAMHGIHAAAAAHTFFHIDENGKLISKQSRGNPNTYLSLRGADHGPNHDPQSVAMALSALHAQALPKSLIIDCSHGNSHKDPAKQLTVFKEVIAQISEGQNHIRGIMLESHILEGRQRTAKENHPDRSITDPCLDWETTALAIRSAHRSLEKQAVAGGDTPPHPL